MGEPSKKDGREGVSPFGNHKCASVKMLYRNFYQLHECIGLSEEPVSNVIIIHDAVFCQTACDTKFHTSYFCYVYYCVLYCY